MTQMKQEQSADIGKTRKNQKMSQ